jgi:hypothetical protein
VTATDLRAPDQPGPPADGPPPPRGPAGPAAPRPRRRWRPKSWRFLRAVVPFAVVFVVFVVTGVAWVANHADPNDPDWLEPASAAGVGSRQLAADLTGGGSHLRRYGNTPAAVEYARQGSVTLMVTAPDEIYDGYLAAVADLPTTDRVVLVEPSAGTLESLGLSVTPTGSRWTTGAFPPGPCRLPEAGAGTAAVVETRYASTGDPAVTSCYDGGLVRVAPGSAGDGAGPEFIVVGAGDVFRNDRQREHRNAALATALLGSHPALAWLALHRPEPAPPVHHGNASGQPFSDGGGSRGSGPTPSPGTANGGSSGSGSGSTSGSSGSPPNPLWSAFPPWAWALAVQLLLAAVGLALWRARRLAVPVAEPLPVVVRSAETVSGRGRLYHRAGARQAALDALRAGALARMQPALRSQLAPDAPPEQVVAAVAERSGWTPEQVTAVLYTAAPTDDAGLAAAVDALDALTRAVAT